MYDEEFSEEKVANEETAQEAAREMAAVVAASEPVIYCGPDKPKMGLKKFSVFVGGLTPAYVDAIAQVPEIMKLIVPYKELEAMREKIAKKGTPEFEYYARIDAM